MSAPVVPAVHHHVLPSGITLVGEEIDSVRSLAVGTWVRVGARHEAAAESGLSHFIEHMVFKGTRTRDAFQLAWALEAVGGHLDAFTGRESTCYYARALDEHLDLALDVLADLTLRPRLDPADIAKEKHVILEEIHNSEDTPDDRIHDLFADAVWRGHPLGNRILGNKETVSAFATGQVAGYHARHYVASNLLIAIAGRFDWQHFVEEAASRFGDAPAGSPTASPGRGTPERSVVHHVESLQQQYLCVGGPGLPHEHRDHYTLALLSTILGGGMSSRLFQRVREEAGLAYSVYTYADSYEDAGMFCASMSLQPEHGRKALRLTLEEFDRIASEGLSPGDLAATKAQLKGGLLLSLESTSSRMHRAARSQLYAGRFITVDELVASIDRITSDDVRRVAADLLARERLSLVALGGSDGQPYDAADLAVERGERGVSERVVVRIFLEPHAFAPPAYQTEHAAGMDLYAALQGDATIAPQEVASIPTGIRLEIPAGFEGQVRARSGLAARHAVGVPNAPGTIDADYRGEVRVLLVNWGHAPFVVKRGDRIAQLVIAPVAHAALEIVPELSVTARGDGGFGHTGR